jgi:hypothetical protein
LRAENGKIIVGREYWDPTRVVAAFFLDAAAAFQDAIWITFPSKNIGNPVGHGRRWPARTLMLALKSNIAARNSRLPGGPG